MSRGAHHLLPGWGHVPSFSFLFPGLPAEAGRGQTPDQAGAGWPGNREVAAAGVEPG